MATNSPDQITLTLSENELVEALEAVHSIQPQNIFDFGLKLGINHNTIKNFQVQCTGDMKGWLREILNERQRREPPLTWHDIVTALRSPLVGEDRLASQIESQYMTHSQPPSSVPQHQGTQLSSVPQHQGTQLSSVPQHHGTQLPSVPQQKRRQLPSVSQQEGTQLLRSHQKRRQVPQQGGTPVPQHQRPQLSQQEGTQLPSVHQHKRRQLPSVPQQRGTQLPSVLQQQGVQLSTTHSGSSSQILVPSLFQSSTAVVTSPIKAFIDYVKTVYGQSEVERDTSVVKWPPTPSKVYINLALIDRHSVSGRSREYDEVTQAMVRDGNVDAIVDVTKGYIDFSKIAKNISIPNSREKATSNERRLILVEGAPGVGKSTFAQEFCRRWERGEIAQQYQLVLLLRLREERISNAESLEDLIYHPSMEVCQTVKREMEFNLGVNTLIILEGFDELPDRSRSSGSVFMHLIAGKLLPLATVLVTSRPWATQEIRLSYGNRIYQHIEILGFTGRQITEYIESTLPQEKVSDLKAYLESHPQIRAGMYIPLNSAIVVTVYEESQASGCAMPTTLTELYTSLTRTILLRYLRGHSEYMNKFEPVQSFKDVPSPIYSKFCEVCKLAYNGTIGTTGQVQLIFRDLPPDFDDLGFMDSVTELYVTRGAVSSHNFLHLTFQEFFAAVHISNMSPAQQVEHFKRHKEGRLKVVLRFLAGLNKLNCFSIEEIANNFFQTASTCEGSRCLISCDAAVGIDPVQWLFEAQSDDVIEHVLGQKTIEFELSSGMLPLDYYSLGYCISCSQCQWVLGLGKEGIDKTEAKMLAAGAATRTGTGGSVVGLKEGTTSFLAKCLNVLLAESKSIVCQQKMSLKLSGHCQSHLITWPDLSALRVLELIICGEHNWKLNTLLPHLSLESLTIVPASNITSRLVYEDCVAINNHITSKTSLKELCILSDNISLYEVITARGVEAITAALASNQSLPLERLELKGECTFTATAGDSLARFITNTTTLKYLSMKNGGFNRVGAITAALARNQSLPLERLELECECTFTATAGDSLARFITNTTTLKYLSMKNGGFNRVETITAALASNQSLPLERLELECRCTFTATAGDSLARFITNTTTLKYLSMKNGGFNRVETITAALASNQSLPLERLELKGECTFTATAGDSLAQFITNTTTLKYLSIKKCTFSAHELLVLASAIHHNLILQTKNVEEFNLTVNGDIDAKWLAQLLKEYPDLVNRMTSVMNGKYIYCRGISDAGAVAIAQALHHNSTLTGLGLSNNSISDAGAVALAQALHHNSTLTKLGLSSNSISDAGAVALAQALHHNSTLTELYLSGSNGIGEEGTHRLVQALTLNTSISNYGLSLPMRCKQYATKCQQYSRVKNRMVYDL